MPPIRDFRLIPIVLLATGSLFGLKMFGLFSNGGYLFADADRADVTIAIDSQTSDSPAPQPPATIPAPPPVHAKVLGLRDLLNFSDITGASESEKSAPQLAKPAGADPAKVEAAKSATGEGPKSMPVEPPPASPGTVISLENDHPTSPAERAILEHLQTRRQELDTRAREIDIRNNLLKEAESRMEAHAAELKDFEARVGTAAQRKDEADAARLKSLVIMYENMKPKDAAKIFDRLDMKILVDLVTQINPRRMSDIMAQMQPDMAERLTAELAAKGAGADKSQSMDNLPKIEGKPPAAPEATN